MKIPHNLIVSTALENFFQVKRLKFNLFGIVSNIEIEFYATLCKLLPLIRVSDLVSTTGFNNKGFVVALL